MAVTRGLGALNKRSTPLRFFLGICAIFSFNLPFQSGASAAEREVGQVTAREIPTPSRQETTGVHRPIFKKSIFPLILTSQSGHPPELTARIEGDFPDHRWALIVVANGKGKVLHCSGSTGHFQAVIPIKQPRTSLNFTVVSSDGRTFSTRMVLDAMDWKGIQEEIKRAEAWRRFHWSLGVGVAYVEYSQNGLPTLSSLLISTQGTVEYWLKPGSWNFELAGFLATPPIATSPSGFSISLLGLESTVGYLLPWVSSPWCITLRAGIYYTTTFTSSLIGTPFGYANIGGPETYPMIERVFLSGSSLEGYFKVLPVLDQLTILSLSNRELASGARYNFPPNQSQGNFFLAFDWMNLRVRQGGTQSTSTILSLGAGYRW